MIDYVVTDGTEREELWICRAEMVVISREDAERETEGHLLHKTAISFVLHGQRSQLLHIVLHEFDDSVRPDQFFQND